MIFLSKICAAIGGSDGILRFVLYLLLCIKNRSDAVYLLRRSLLVLCVHASAL